MFGSKKRTFKSLQTIILKTLQNEKHTPYEIAKKTSLHFNVVQNQLILLKGHDYVNEHKHFKLFTITEKGLKYLSKESKK